jgi:hypothetical protein
LQGRRPYISASTSTAYVARGGDAKENKTMVETNSEAEFVLLAESLRLMLTQIVDHAGIKKVEKNDKEYIVNLNNQTINLGKNQLCSYLVLRLIGVRVSPIEEDTKKKVVQIYNQGEAYYVTPTVNGNSANITGMASFVMNDLPGVSLSDPNTQAKPLCDRLRKIIVLDVNPLIQQIQLYNPPSETKSGGGNGGRRRIDRRRILNESTTRPVAVDIRSPRNTPETSGTQTRQRIHAAKSLSSSPKKATNHTGLSRSTIFRRHDGIKATTTTGTKRTKMKNEAHP